MHRLMKKEQLLTIPNLLSVVRLLLIPLIVWLYCARQEYELAVLFILLSGATDVVDGFIARRFHMVSDFGKILDPVADKLTQGALIAGLTYLALYFSGIPQVAKGFAVDLLLLAGYALPASLIGQWGDLAMSAVKRCCHIKDFGTLLPGHGGILDRFDSALLTIPFTYLFCSITGGYIL